MQAKGIEQEMNTYFMQLTIAEQKSVVAMLKAFLKKDKQTKPVSIAEYNKDIDDTMAEVSRGEFYTHSQVVEMSKHW